VEDYTDDDDDMGCSRTTHLGDYDEGEDEVGKRIEDSEEEDGADPDYRDIDECRDSSGDQCPLCGNQGSKPIPMRKNSRETRRTRSTSTSSFGAGSPPQHSPHAHGPLPEFKGLCLKYAALVIVVVAVNSVGHSQIAKDITNNVLPWLLKKVSQIYPSK